MSSMTWMKLGVQLLGTASLVLGDIGRKIFCGQQEDMLEHFWNELEVDEREQEQWPKSL